MHVVALVGDLMDRSRISGAQPEVVFAQTAAECAGADVVIVDLARHASALRTVREQAPDARIVAFGPHVDDASLTNAQRDGADRVLPRSRFFRDIVAAIA